MIVPVNPLINHLDPKIDRIFEGCLMSFMLVFFIGCSDGNETKSDWGESQYDVIIYGASSSGVAASIAAARNGVDVLLISEDDHIGGLTTSGLTATDMNSFWHVGGISREFYQNIYNAYLNDELWKYEERGAYFERSKHRTYGGRNEEFKMQWVFESKVAKKIFLDMLSKEGIEVRYNSRLKATNMKGSRIASIQMDNGEELSAKYFIDASYSGDLMASSNVSFTAKRESKDAYREELAGYGHLRPYPASALDGTTIDPFVVKGDPSSGLLPYLKEDEGQEQGSSSPGIQAYCFRMTLTNWAPNRIEIRKPEKYDALLYEYLLRRIGKEDGRTSLKDIFTTTPMPNYKTDTNGIDFVGANGDWWSSDNAGRKAIEEEHRIFSMGMLWFFQNDSRVPSALRAEAREWGLAKDEFIENSNFPPRIYVRESRRMISDYVMTEHNCFLNEIAPYSIGFGTYAADSHVVQRIVNNRHEVLEEGHFYEKAGRYRIGYKSIIPKAGECSNIFVPVCLSASHVAYGSIRMEPVFMVLGHSAGTAAALCVEQGVSVHDLGYDSLKKQLETENQVL